MAKSELYYIRFCGKQIEKKYSVGNGHGYTQRDLEILAQQIEEKTGFMINLNTLKRFWRSDFKQSPQIATLVALMDFRDWQDFKQSNGKSPNYSRPLIVGIVMGVSIIFITSYIIRGLTTHKNVEVAVTSPKVNGPVHCSAEKAVTSEIPNTVIFKHDVLNVDAGSFLSNNPGMIFTECVLILQVML